MWYVERYEAHIKRNQIKRDRSVEPDPECQDHSLHVFHRIPPGFLPYRTWTVPIQKHRESDTGPPRRTGHRGELRGSFVPRASSAPLCALWAAGPKTRSQNSTIAGHAELLTYKARWRGLAAHEERLAMSHHRTNSRSAPTTSV